MRRLREEDVAPMWTTLHLSISLPGAVTSLSYSVGAQEVNMAGDAAFSQPLAILHLLPTCLPGMFWVGIREAKRY